MIRKITTKGWRLVATITGILLLVATILARWLYNQVVVNNWRIQILSGSAEGGEIFSFPLIYLFLGAVSLGLIIIWKNQTLRQAWLNLKQDKRYLRNFLLAATLFSLTMIPLYHSNQDFVTYLITGTFGIFLLFYGIYPVSGWVARFVSRLYRVLINLPIFYFLLICAGVVLIITNLLSLICFQHKPIVTDTIAQLFHARIFAQGKLYLPAPTFPEFFDVGHVISNNGRWFSQYPPCHPALLAIGVLLGMPWLINPLLGAGAVMVFFYLGKELYDDKTGRIAALLGTGSPFLLYMSSEFMNHASALLFISLFVWFFFRMVRKQSFLSALLAGTFLGLAINVRPYTALAIATPFIVYSCYLLSRNLRRHLPRLSLMAGVTALFIGILLYYNYLTNGNPLIFGYSARWGSVHDLGFGRSAWGPVHTPLRGLLFTAIELNALNRFLFDWSIPSLVFITLLFGASRAKLKDYLLLAVSAAPVVAYFFYWSHGILFGPRWEYETLGALVVLTARGMLALPDFIQNQLRLAVPREKVLNGLKMLLGLCFIFTLLIPINSRMSTWYPKHLLTVHAPIIEQAKKLHLKNAVVVTAEPFYHSAFGGNQLDLKGEVVYARDLGPLKPLLQTIYPGRKFFRATSDSFYEIEVPAYAESPLYEALWAQSEFTRQMTKVKYRTLLWPATSGWEPFRSLLGDTTVKIVPQRQFNIDIYGRLELLDDYLPAIVFWIFQDQQPHLQIFSYMDDGQSYIAAGYKFTLKYITPNKVGAVYEIDKVKGDEEIKP